MWYERNVYCKWIENTISGTIIIFEKDNLIKIIVINLNDDCYLISVKKTNDINYKVIADTIQNYYCYKYKYSEIIHSGEYTDDIKGIDDKYTGYFEDGKFIFTKPKNYMEEL